MRSEPSRSSQNPGSLIRVFTFSSSIRTDSGSKMPPQGGGAFQDLAIPSKGFFVHRGSSSSPCSSPDPDPNEAFSGEFKDFFFGIERGHCDNRTEDLFLIDAAIDAQVCDDRGLDEISIFASRVNRSRNASAAMDSPTFLACQFQV